MGTLATSAYLDSQPGELTELPRAGSALENPFVYDASAREIEDMAARGLVEIVQREPATCGSETLIGRIRFRRLR